jgi:hypothetical protein
MQRRWVLRSKVLVQGLLLAALAMLSCGAPKATRVSTDAAPTATSLETRERTASPAVVATSASTATSTSSPSPASPTKEPLVISPREFGGIPNDSADDGQALRVAMAKAASEPGAVVVLEEGTYLVDGTDGGYHLTVSGAEGLRIEGHGARLVMRNPSSAGMLLHNCSDVTVRDITIDYDPVPFSQGSISAVDASAGTFEMAVDEGYPHPRSWFFLRAPLCFGTVRHRETAMLREDVGDHLMIDRWEAVEDGVYRAYVEAGHYRSQLASVQVGDAFVYVARAGGGAVDVQGSSNVTVENVTVHASTTSAMTLLQADAVTIRGLRVAIAPDTDRLNSTNADGVHCQQARVGPRIEDSHFEGMSDDAINIYTVPNLVREVLSDARIAVTGAGQMRAGDELEIWDPVSGALRGHGTIASLEVADGRTLVTLSEAIAGMRAGADYRTADHVYNRNACGEGFAIVNNTFQNHRRYAVFIKSGHGLIEGNSVRNLSGNGIVIANEPDWPEGPMSREVTIRGNVIEHVGFGGSYGLQPDGAAIHVKGNKLGFGLAAWRGQRDIVIEDNTIRDWPRNAIYLGSAERVTLRNNRLETVHRRPDIPVESAVGVLIENCAHVVIEGLELSEPRAIQAVVRINGASDIESITVDGLTGSVAEGVPQVMSDR